MIGKISTIPQIFLAPQSIKGEIERVESDRDTTFFWSGRGGGWGKKPSVNGRPREVSFRVVDLPEQRPVRLTIVNPTRR
jgi:hypothetical protein